MSKLGALDRAMVAMRNHLGFHGAKGDGLCVSKADDRLVVETNPSDAGMSARDVGEGLRGGKRNAPLREGEIFPEMER